MKRVDAEKLANKIIGKYDYIYMIKDNYYVLGQNNFRLCTENEIGVYKMYLDSEEGNDENWIIDQYWRVRRYVSDCKSFSKKRDNEILGFVSELDDSDLELLNEQVERADKYALIKVEK